MKKKLTILVDMDDTITWLLPIWVDWLNNKYSLDVQWKEILEWDMSLAFPTLTREQIYEPLITEEIWDSVIPRNGAIEILTKLHEEGHKIFICTATDYRNIKPKFEKVIKKYFPFITWDNIIVASNKQMINGDILIDDAIHNLIGGGYIKFLIDTPYNHSFKTKKNGIIKVHSWKEIYDLINKIVKED